MQLTVWSVTVVLILAEFKLLLQNGSIRLSQLQEAQPPGVFQPPPGSRGTDPAPVAVSRAGDRPLHHVELGDLPGLSAPSTNPSHSPRVCLPGVGQSDTLRVGAGEVTRCIRGHFPKGLHLQWGGWSGPCWLMGECCKQFVTSVKSNVPSLTTTAKLAEAPRP